MAAEQRGCRETLIVHSEWLSVRERRGSAEEEGGREVEGDQILGTVDRVLYRRPRLVESSAFLIIIVSVNQKPQTFAG